MSKEDNLMNFKAIPSTVGAIAVPAFEFMYGEGDVVRYAMTALVFFVLMDWLSGVRAAKKDQTYSSRYGIDGVFRSAFILALPAGGHMLDKIAGVPGVLFGLLAFGVLYHVIQSMTANVIRAGWAEWVPTKVLEALTKWVGSELEAKLRRATFRQQERTGDR